MHDLDTAGFSIEWQALDHRRLSYRFATRYSGTRSAPDDKDMRFRYAPQIRTTILLDDRLAMQVRREAAAKGLNVSGLINKTLDDAIKCRENTMDKPFRFVTVGGGGPNPGIYLVRPRTHVAPDDEIRFAGRDR